MPTKRKFNIVTEILDSKGPEETNEVAAKAMKSFLLDCFGDLAFDVKSIEVTCE